MEKPTTQILAFTVCTVLGAAGGCTSTDPVRVEEDFGNSVRHMIQAQIHDPQAAANPPVDPPMNLDGAKADNILKSYRKDVSKPEQIEKPLQITIGK